MKIQELKALIEATGDSLPELCGIVISGDKAVATDKYVLLYIEYPYEIEEDVWIGKEEIKKRNKGFIDVKDNKIVFSEDKIEIENNKEFLEKYPDFRSVIEKFSNYKYEITLDIEELEKVIKAAKKLKATKIKFKFNIEKEEVKDEPIKIEIKKFDKIILKGLIGQIKDRR